MYRLLLILKLGIIGMKHTKKILPIILCGGHGTRLWPASREAWPKQFIKINSQYNLFQETILRVKNKIFDMPILVCNERHKSQILTSLREVNCKVERIILSRPAVEAGERLGFLPGDMKEKIDPYLRPLYDSLNDLFDYDKIQRKIESGQIEIAPLAFMRGRTLKNSFAILDEAQNATRTQIKMFLTRIGENSKLVVNGDPSQIDLPNKKQSGLIESKTILKGIKEISIVNFDHNDVIRHPLVTKIVEAYQKNTND